MDSYTLSDYEIIHETLSTTESDSETDSLPISDSSVQNKKRRRVQQNFIICQPIGKKKSLIESTTFPSNNPNDKAESSKIKAACEVLVNNADNDEVICIGDCLPEEDNTYSKKNRAVDRTQSSDNNNSIISVDQYQMQLFGSLNDSLIKTGSKYSSGSQYLDDITLLSILEGDGDSLTSDKVDMNNMGEENDSENETTSNYKIVIENMKTEDLSDELINENVENDHVKYDWKNSTYNYDDLERKIALLTGEQEAEERTDVNWMGYDETEDNCNHRSEVVDDFPVEVKYNPLQWENRPGIENAAVKVSNLVNTTSYCRENSNIVANHGNNLNSDARINEICSDLMQNGEFPPTAEKKTVWEQKQKFENFLDTQMTLLKLSYPGLTRRAPIPGLGMPCPDCKSYFKTVRLLKKHWARKHDPRKPLLQCSQCSYKTLHTDLLNSHFKHMHSLIEESFKCEMCHKSYKTRPGLKKHVKMAHTDISNMVLFKCSQCKFSSYHEHNLSRHYERKHVSNGFLCVYCGVQFKSKLSIEKHEKFHQGLIPLNFTCKQCNEHFENKMDLLSHVNIVHSKQPVYFNCDICDYQTLNKELLIVHSNVIHHNQKHFKCSDCPSVMKDLETLARHVSRKHNPYLVWFFCANCSYKTHRKSSMASHVIKHLPRRKGPIKCKLCSYRTYKKYYFDRHFNTRHNPLAIEYQCYHCGYKNKVKWKLHQHMLQLGHILS